MSATRPTASVIIPVHDAQATLRACLASVFASRGVSFEVLVVDDASTDDSRAIALQFPGRVLALRSNVWAANCRNLGARHAIGEILVFVDADEVMPPDALARFVAVLREHPEVDAVVGSYGADTPMPGFFSKFKNLAHHTTHQTARREGATLHSGLMAIRRPVFEAAGGFEPAYGPASIEDIALGYRLHRQGRRVWFRPEIQLTHLKRYTFFGLLRSDLLHRAIPWTGLMLRERIWRSDLNTRSGNVASVAAAWALPLAAALPWFREGVGWGAAGGVALVALAGIWGLNRGLLRAGWCAFGGVFLLRSLFFLPVMYFCQGAGLLAGVAAYALGWSVARRREAPTPVYEVLEGGRGEP